MLQVFDFPSVAALASFIGSKLPASSPAASKAHPITAPAVPLLQLVSTVAAAPVSTSLAVTGMSYRLPGMQGSSQVLSALDTVTRIPYNRWDVGQASQQVNELQASFASFLSDPAGFDAAAFGLPEAEAVLMDPQQRQLMEVSWESLGPALSAAGAGSAAAYRAACGVFVGVSSRDYFTLGKQYAHVRMVDQQPSAVSCPTASLHCLATAFVQGRRD